MNPSGLAQVRFSSEEEFGFEQVPVEVRGNSHLELFQTCSQAINRAIHHSFAARRYLGSLRTEQRLVACRR